MNIQKPPEKIITLKTSLKKIIKKQVFKPLNDFILRTHKLTILAYQFIEAFLLFQFHNSKEFPILNDDFVNMAFKALYNNPGPGRRSEGSKALLLAELINFYHTEFKLLTNEKKEFDASHLSHVLGYSVTSVLTCIKNNIILHFIPRLKKFVKISFQHELESFKNLSYKQKKLKKTEHYKELKLVLDDLINNTLLSPSRFHFFIDEIRSQFLPPYTQKSLTDELVSNPHLFLKAMIKFNLFYEAKGLKLFKAFPLRTDIVPKYISIDTAVLVDLFITKNLNDYFSNIEEHKVTLWSQLFDMKKKIFKMKNYTFDFFVSTDGCSVSIKFLHNSYVETEKQRKAIMQTANNITRELNKNKTQEEKENTKEKKIEEKIAKRSERNKERREIAKKKIKKMSDIEKNYKLEEFPYFDLLNDEDTEYLRTHMDQIVYIDPGKRSIYYMMNDNDKTPKYLTYNNRQRISETKRLKYNKIRENYKKKHVIMKKLEDELANFNSMTCNYEKFKKYVKKKNEANALLFVEYENKLFRKLKWHHFINKQRSESNLMNRIEKTYGKNPIIIMGDWSMKGKLKYMSTPGISLKRKLAKRFTIYNVDEFRTSCIEYKSEKKCENLSLPDKKGKLREKHAILSYQNENKREGYRNRDKNSVNNIKKIVRETLKTGERPLVYRRNYELKETGNQPTHPEKLLSELKKGVGNKSVQPSVRLSSDTHDPKINGV